MCGILSPTAGRGWLAYVGVSNEYPGLDDLVHEIDDEMWTAALLVLEERKREDPLPRALADELAVLWTWATVSAGMLPLGTPIVVTTGSSAYEGKLRPRDRYDGPEFGNDRLGVDWQERRLGDWRPDVKPDTEVEARVPVPFDLSALLAQIEREIGQQCRPVPRRRRREGDRKWCDSCGRTGTRGFRVTDVGTWCTGITSCRRRRSRGAARNAGRVTGTVTYRGRSTRNGANSNGRHRERI